jgi:hypothetical protein
VIRPFLLTGGRTQSTHHELRIESLVRSRPGGRTEGLRFEGRRIVELCQEPLSLAELAVSLGVPLGVARVLVSDLVDAGTVTLAQREDWSVQLLERIRDGVRAL